QPVPVRSAPVEIAGVLRYLDDAEMLAVRGKDPDPVRPGHPDVAALVALHSVDVLCLRGVTDALREQTAVRDGAVVCDVEHADVRVISVVDVEQRLVGREAESVRLSEVVDEQRQLAAARRDPVHALEVKLLFPLDPETRHASVRRVAEVDRPARVHDHVVRAVELLALVVAGDHLAASPAPIWIHARDGARRVLADDQAAVGVERDAVALVARLRHLARAALLLPAPARVAGHVAAEEVPARRVPDRPLRECESGPDLLDFGRRVDQVVELLRLGLDTHTRLLSLVTECVPNLPRVPPSKPAPPTPSSFHLDAPRRR